MELVLFINVDYLFRLMLLLNLLGKIGWRLSLALMVLQILQSAILFENEVSLVDVVVCGLFRHLLVLNFYTDAFLVLGQRRVADVDDLKL